MRMTATGVVHLFHFFFLVHLTTNLQSLDHGSTWHACPCSQCKVRNKVNEYRQAITSTRLCPVDAIMTRMGAYDNMFSHASTFKVELDEWWTQNSFAIDLFWCFFSCKILREATPKSLVILDGNISLCASLLYSDHNSQNLVEGHQPSYVLTFAQLPWC